jgi:hypothetical protein
MFLTHRRPLAIRSLMLVALSTVLFSFSEKIGGDSFSVYLNDKLLLQQYVSRDVTVKSVSLNETATGDVLKIYYSECGKIGRERNISLKDGKDNVLKSWHFPDAAEGASNPPMICKVKDIMTLQKSNGNSIVKLVYSSRELPEGRILAAIPSGDTKASLK